MSNNCSAILEWNRTGKRQCAIIRLLGVSRQTISDAINRFKELGHDGRRPGSGRKHTVNAPRKRMIIKKWIQQKSRVSMRKIARETDINRESVHQIAKKVLKLKPFKLQKAQLLTKENKQVRLEKCRQLKRRAADQRWKRILFTDENLFTVEQTHNH